MRMSKRKNSDVAEDSTTHTPTPPLSPLFPKFEADVNNTSGTSREKLNPTRKVMQRGGDAEKSKRHRASHRAILRGVHKAKEVLKYLIQFGRQLWYQDELLTTEKIDSKDIPRQDLLDLAARNGVFVNSPDDRNSHTLILNLDDHTAHWKAANNITAPLFQENKLVSEQALRDHGFFFLTGGTTYGVQKINGKEELVLSVAFWPWKTMSAKDVADFKFLAEWFISRERDGHTKPIAYNAAHAAGGNTGIMCAQGWRPGTDKGCTYGVYADVTPIPWEDLQDDMMRVAEIYRKCWARVAPHACEAAADFVQEHQLPELGAMKKDEKTGLRIPASNLTWSHKNFANIPHVDFDISPATAGMWFSSRTSGDLIDNENEECGAHQGGHFFWPDYGLAADFNKNPGVAFLMWRGKDDRHATAMSTSKAGYERFGSSVQVTRRLFNAVKRVQAGLGMEVNDATRRQSSKRFRIDKADVEAAK